MSKHTPGPWRWQIDMRSKRLKLLGGERRFDLALMDFDRWGMRGAIVNLRDPAVDGMNIMHRLCDRPDWIAPFPGREHHADWCASVTHPDMRLIAAAPDLLEALKAYLAAGYGNSTSHSLQCKAYDLAIEAIAKAEGQS